MTLYLGTFDIVRKPSLLPTFKCNHLNFFKDLINRFREKFRNADFAQKNAPFTPFWAQEKHFSNNNNNINNNNNK